MVVIHEQCPLCEEGCLHERMSYEMHEYRGKHGQVPLYFAECDVCGSDQAGADHVRRNKRALLAFKKSVDGLLSGAEVRAIREQLGISQAQAAKIFGGGPVAFSKYESDDVAQSEGMDKLLRLAAFVPEAFSYLAEQAGVPLIERSWVDITPAEPRKSHLRLVQSWDVQPIKRYA